MMNGLPRTIRMLYTKKMVDDNKIFLLSKRRKYKERKVKDNSYLSYMKGIMNGWKEKKILSFPFHKIIRKLNNDE